MLLWIELGEEENSERTGRKFLISKTKKGMTNLLSTRVQSGEGLKVCWGYALRRGNVFEVIV